jgi:hypothetical protein
MERAARNSAYRLTWEFDHLEFCNKEYDAEAHQFEGWSETRGFYSTTPYELPDPVIFYTDFDLLAYTDYPCSDADWPIMSRRMYDILIGLGDFPHRVIPIAMIHRRLSNPRKPPKLFLKDGKPNPELTNFDDYVAVQLLEESDFFDFEHSKYEPNLYFPKWVRSVEKYELKEPVGGFPPLFRLEADSVVLFISETARLALLEAGIRGMGYYNLDDGLGLQKEIDIPVELPTLA